MLAMSLFSRNRTLPLRKSKRLLRQTYQLYRRKKKRLSREADAALVLAFQSLQQAIEEKNRERADVLAKELSHLAAVHLRKTFFDQIREFVVAIAFALCVATLVRQVWFEFYEIPTGSMRPTFKEQDRLTVTKTNFGINFPLRAAHFYFDPALAERMGIIVFTGANMDIADVDTLYFYLFPGKKQYIKRLIGKPGDILYFYGGKIYGIDREGKDISAELQVQRLEPIEHIPFMSFDRKISLPPTPTDRIFSPVLFYQMNQPVAKLSLSKMGSIVGEMLPIPTIHAPDAPPIKEYFDLWGMQDFGMARLLTRQEVLQFTPFIPSQIGEGVLYLEIVHHPTLQGGKLMRDEYGRVRPTLAKSTSVLPLKEEHLQALFHSLYTARFCVKNEIAYRYGCDKKYALANPYAVRLPGVEDGCYEFYYGKAYKVLWQGVTKELPASHPLMHFTPELMQLLYNAGIEWDLRIMPQGREQMFPSRYIYFRDGDVYLLGSPILHKDDPLLIQFLEKERARQTSSAFGSFHAFEDTGAPLLADGTLDKARIQQYGLRIPEKSYLALGDNHAMSADSRDFGFVPESNLRGAPYFIFWPPGARWGWPNQLPYPSLTLPRIVVWCAAALFIGFGYWYWKRRNRLRF